MRQYRIPLRHFSECTDPVMVCREVYDDMHLSGSRQDMIRECIRRGVADRTAETQIDRWRRADRKIRYTALEKAQHVS
jgi:hypothetical protein